ncbi:MAG: hypothetical protein ACYSWW_02050 [Planctomycetota bacterium]|jgi:predicted type IV restriction endonuclease
MDRDRLRQHILKVRGWPVLEFGENQAKTSIIQPIFDCLGWETSDPEEAKLEYALSPEGRVDYAFLKSGDPTLFVEAKAPRESLDGHTRQLLKYSFAKDVKLAVLTNGVEWWLYLPMEGGEWDDRKFCSIDLMRQDIEQVCDGLTEFLRKENVLSGKALTSAKQMRKSTERETKVAQTLPEVWKSIITEPNDVLVDLLIQETERTCGYKPDESMVKSFIKKTVLPPEPLLPEGTDDLGRGSGLLIYVPHINAETFLHFSWVGESCALRDYSYGPTTKPKLDRRYTTSYVRARITDQAQVEQRNIKHIDYWHRETLRLNRSIK